MNDKRFAEITAENNTRFVSNCLRHGRYFTLKIIESLFKVIIESL